MKTLGFARGKMRWAAIRDSLWFLPGLLTACGAALAYGAIYLDQVFDIGSERRLWIFGGGAEGARGVLSTIAGGLITVTGVVFSVTIVALQLASTQFTPRILRNFTADRANQTVLGVFIGTFTYTLLVLRSVRSSSNAEVGFVPAVAVAMAVLLVLLSIGFLIFFIHHAARSIQVSFLVNRVTNQSVELLLQQFPELQHGDARDVQHHPGDRDPVGEIPLVMDRAGYIQSIDEEALIQLAVTANATLYLQRGIGDFILPGERFATATPAAALSDGFIDSARRTIVTGSERTPEEDLEFGIIELSDIAVKALSPGINDPTTAMLCIDRLSEILAVWGKADIPRYGIRHADGKVRLVRPITSFERAVGLAFDQITHFGADNPAILKRQLDMIERLQSLVSSANLPVLEAQARKVKTATA